MHSMFNPVACDGKSVARDAAKLSMGYACDASVHARDAYATGGVERERRHHVKPRRCLILPQGSSGCSVDRAECAQVRADVQLAMILQRWDGETAQTQRVDPHLAKPPGDRFLRWLCK